MAFFRVSPLFAGPVLANGKAPVLIGLYRQPFTPCRHEALAQDDRFMARCQGGSVRLRVKPVR